MNKIQGLVLLMFILLVSLLFLLISLFLNSSQKQKPPKTNYISPTNFVFKDNEQIKLTGMLWTSGLMDEEKNRLGIDSDYQLERSMLNNNWGEKIDGMYLLGDFDLRKYLGKCVDVMGKIEDGWQDLENNKYEINNQYTYGRSAMIVSKIDITQYNNCYVGNDIVPTLPEDPDYEQVRQTFRGTIGFSKRPAPDIDYDLELLLEKPYLDQENATGQSIWTNRIDIAAASEELLLNMLGNIGKKVEVEGYWQWGYAESRFFRVDKMVIE